MKKNNKIKIGINGFGRIGRLLTRIMLKNPKFEIVAINAPSVDMEYAKYLLKHDTIHGLFDEEIKVGKNYLEVCGQKITFLSDRDPANLPWGKLGAEYICEATGKFKTIEDCSAHLRSGAKKVIITAPGKDTPMFVYGVNHNEYKKSQDVVSNASCTTNCLAPLTKLIDEVFGIEEGLMTTIHSTTATQVTVDGKSKKDYRGGRAASYNIIPSSTGAAEAVGKVYPKVKGKLTGMSFRVPTLNVSAIDLTVRLKTETTYEEIVKAVKKAEKGKYKGIIQTTNEPVVSSDFIGNPYACIFDITAGIMLSPTFVKLVGWYDNEWGYSTMVTKLIEHMFEVDNK